jgi:hypothetical protein
MRIHALGLLLLMLAAGEVLCCPTGATAETQTTLVGDGQARCAIYVAEQELADALDLEVSGRTILAIGGERIT